MTQTHRQTHRNTAKPITPAQIRRIHQIIHILNISDENYRAALDSRFNVTSCKNLTLHQAHTFIDELEKLALKFEQEKYEKQRKETRQQAEPERFSNFDNRPNMASGAQLRKIEAQFQDISEVA